MENIPQSEFTSVGVLEELVRGLGRVASQNGCPKGKFISVGCWVLGVGCWVLGVGCWVLGAGPLIYLYFTFN